MSSESAWERLSIDHTSGIPIFVQLRTQLEYAIATGSIPSGERLPGVRGLAQHLGVAVDTVRQAYEELGRAGLVETRHGVGTRVILPVESVGGGGVPESRQTALVDNAVVDLLGAGVRPGTLSALVRQRLAMLETGLNIAFVGVGATADRYANLLSETLPGGLRPVRAIGLEDLRQSRVPREELANITHVVSLLFHIRQIETCLSGYPIRVLPLMSELEPAVLQRIAGLSAEDVPVLVARPTTRPIYEALIQARRPDLAVLAFASDEDADEVRSLSRKATVVLHTSVAAHLVEDAADPGVARIELRHGPTADSLNSVAKAVRGDWELALRLRDAGARQRLAQEVD